MFGMNRRKINRGLRDVVEVIGEHVERDRRDNFNGACVIETSRTQRG
jgi:hypothetical protein